MQIDYRWGDAGQRSGDDTGFAAPGHDGDRPGGDVEDELAGAVTFGNGDRGGDRRVSAERNLRLRAEVADVVLADCAVTAAQEGSLRIADVPGEG